MALIIADRVKETATTTGTGTFTLGGAVTGFRTFNAGIGTGNTTYYCIFLDGTNEFEVGLGTYTAPDQLARDTVLASSNSGSKVNFSQGIKSVFCTQPSSKAAYLDASGNLSITTSNITEGTNLYYTDARFDTRLATKDTADLSEGTNLYYTDARARAAISVSGNAIAYNSTTGVITANFEESPTFTGNVVVSGNLTVTGTTTWLDSTNTQISDKNIVLNYASGDSSANANGAGITIQDAVDASTDASLTWNATDDNFEISHGLDFGDNSKARFGAGNDLQIYSDGTHSYIEETNGSGNFFIKAESFNVGRQANSELYITAQPNGAVTLYHDNSAKLTTTSSGIDVTGSVVSDGLDLGDNEKIRLGASQDLQVYHTGFDSYIDNFTGHLVIRNQANNKDIVIQTDDGSGNLTDYMRFNGSNEIINISKNVGIGTTSPSKKLHVQNGSSGFSGSYNGRTAAIFEGSASNGTTISIMSPSTGFSAVYFGDESQEYAGQIAYEHSVNAMKFLVSAGEKMRINSAGNLGIGTDSPNQKLEIKTTSGTTGLRIHSDHETSPRTAIEFMRGTTDTFGGDAFTDWKIGHVGSDQADFAIVSSDSNRGTNERVTIEYNTGNVGIGTSSPVAPLVVSNGGAAGMEFHPELATDTNRLTNYDRTASAYMNYRQDALTHQFYVSGSEKMRITNAGSVGIGTDSPSKKLHVNSGTSDIVALFESSDTTATIELKDPTASSQILNSVGMLILKADPSNASGSTRIGFETDGSERMRITNDGYLFLNHTNSWESLGTIVLKQKADDRGLGIVDDAGQNAFQIINNGSVAGIKYNVDNPITFSQSSGERMRINGLGNLGIGNSNPSGKLHVYDSGTDTYGTQPIAIFDYYDTDDAALRYSARIGDGSTTFKTFVTNAAPDFLIVDQDNTAGRLSFQVQGNAGNIESLAVDSTGLVGIGTSSPSYKTEIVGGNNYSQLRLTNSASDNTNKYSGLSFEQYDVDEEGFLGLGGFSSSSENAVLVGGGTSTFNAATRISFMTAANGTTTTGSERMRIDSSGNLLVGKTSADNTTEGTRIDGDGLISSVADGDAALLLNRLTSDGTIALFRKDNTTVGTISVTGSATAYNTSSDARLKDITGEARGLEVINELNPVAYDWKADGKSDEGLIAQEVMELVPNAVSETQEGYYQMDYSKLVTPLIKAVQELTAKVESLEAQLANK